VGVRVRIERTERLGERVRATAISGSEEMCQCDSWIQNRAGQSDCGGRVSENSIGCGTNQTHGKNNAGHHCNRGLDIRRRNGKKCGKRYRVRSFQTRIHYWSRRIHHSPDSNPTQGRCFERGEIRKDKLWRKSRKD